MYDLSVLCLFLTPSVTCYGLMLLYRPRDISNECAFSHRLRYDISYGMGMSDTITLVFRTLTEVDYECSIEIVTELWAHIVVVVKYPTTLGINCGANKDAITVMKKTRSLRLCDLIGERDLHSPYFIAAVPGRIRFRFLSNSSINSDINANFYQVTATSARPKPDDGCIQRNESICVVNTEEFCFSSGVVCDGINNCGVADWFDERKSECGQPIEKLGYTPIIAVIAALLCALLAAGHILLRCLPPLANSFFIFNANEDNRLRIDPVFKSPGNRSQSIERATRTSLIPVSSSSSIASSTEEVPPVIAETLQCLSISRDPSKSTEGSSTIDQPTAVPPLAPADPRRKTTIRTMAERFQKKILKEKKPKPVLNTWGSC